MRADETRIRLTAALTGIACAIVLITLLTFLLDEEGQSGAFLLDLDTQVFRYPFTIQNVMWIMFFIGAGEVFVRVRNANRETAQIGRHLLPEDDSVMLRLNDLGPINSRIRSEPESMTFFLQRLINRCILQFQASKSVDQTNSLLNSSLELQQHEIDTNYSMLRYLIWLIPTLGFIGTLVGIADALAQAGAAPDPQSKELLGQLTSSLAVAFYTTLLALIHSAILVFAFHIAQAREELALNRAGQYCLDNLINKLYEL